MVRRNTTSTTIYNISQESIVSVEKGNVEKVAIEELDNCFVAFTAGICPDTLKPLKLVLKGRKAFFVYNNFLQEIGTISRRIVCPTTGINTLKKVLVSYEGVVKDIRNKEIVLTINDGSDIKFDFEYTV
jgi:hypothetical protein